ncbi:MAG TPA: thiamine phosphate synthase [Rhizomicrobium sp.]|nr:thiamine phosphate synthase [Rhizomicrobium sp.]
MTERCRLYLITPPKLEAKAFAETLRRALGAGDVASLQLRLKDVGDDAIRRAVEILMPIAQRADVAFILNDRPDLAHEMRCDGVHVGQEDASVAEARQILGKNAIVGATCHDSRHLAIEAAEAGADYVAFGAFFPTATKDGATPADIETLRWWSEMMVVPVVAIGGITAGNARPLIEAGADFLAVSSGVWDHAEGPAAAVMAFNALLEDTP